LGNLKKTVPSQEKNDRVDGLKLVRKACEEQKKGGVGKKTTLGVRNPKSQHNSDTTDMNSNHAQGSYLSGTTKASGISGGIPFLGSRIK